MSSNLFAQAHEGFKFMESPSLGFGIAILVGIALVLAASTLTAHRKLSWSASLTQGFTSLVWASPVIAVLAVVGMRVVPFFQFGTQNQPVANTSPSWLRTATGANVNVDDVSAFADEIYSVSLDRDEDAEKPLPEWVTKKVQRLESTKGKPQEEVWRITIESGVDEADWKLSEAEARASLTAKASALVVEDFRRFHPGNASLLIEKVQSQIVKQELMTERMFGKESDPFKGYKAYWQVELSPKVRKELSGTWKTEVAMRRAELLAATLGLMTFFAGAFAAYFHLDKKSNGQYRFRLKLAATALMTAAGLGLLAAMASAA